MVTLLTKVTMRLFNKKINVHSIYHQYMNDGANRRMFTMLMAIRTMMTVKVSLIQVIDHTVLLLSYLIDLHI